MTKTRGNRIKLYLNREVEIYPIFDQKSIGASKLIDNFTRMLSKFLVRILICADLFVFLFAHKNIIKRTPNSRILYLKSRGSLPVLP